MPDAASPSAKPFEDAQSVEELLGQAIEFGSSLTGREAKHAARQAMERHRELTGPIATVVEEWTVSGSQDGYAPYEFTYRSVDTRYDGDPEGAARRFIKTIAGRGEWVDGPHLDRRTVTYGERQRVEIEA